jgi:putative FmdB family regulatory protein
MPIYEYRCEQGHTFEVMQRMTDDPVSTCQTCESPVARVFHPVAVHFKGSGFYNTDYGTRKRAREKAESSESSTGDSGSKAETKTETKSESKASAPASSD